MKKAKLKISLDKLSLNKETIKELSHSQMGNVVGGVITRTCLSLGGGVGCNGSNATNCYSQCQGGCDYSFGACNCDPFTWAHDCSVQIPTLSNDCTLWCDNPPPSMLC